MSQVAHQAEAYPSFCSMKQLGVFLLPPGWDASPLQGHPQHKVLSIYALEWRESMSELSVFPKNNTECFQPVLEPGPFDAEMSALTMRPPYLHLFV